MATSTVPEDLSTTPPARPWRRTLRATAATTSLVALTGVFLVGSPSAQAATIDVTTTADGGAGSLRAAISQANADPGPDIIQVPAGTYTLTLAGAGEDANVTGDLDIVGDLTILGAGPAATVIDAGGIDRVIDVRSGTTTLQSVTVSNGDSGPGTSSGGGIRQESGNLNVFDSVVRDNRSWAGGGINSRQGTLDIRRSEIIDNVVEGQPGNGSHGAGFEKGNADGALMVRDTLVAGNQAIDGNAGGMYTNVASVSVANSTFTGNSQYASTIVLELYNHPTGTASFAFVTIAANASSGPTGGILSNVGDANSLDLTLEGVLLQDNTSSGGAENCATQGNGAFTSLGSNLADDTTCTALTQPTDLVNDTSTTLGPLANNGGPTRTAALLAGSSAIDAAVCDAAVPTDQRGALRPGGAICDVGAFEVGAVVPSTTTTTTAAPTTTTTAAPTTTTTAAPTTTTTAAPTTTTTAAPTTTTTAAPTTTTTAAPVTTTAAPTTSTTAAVSRPMPGGVTTTTPQVHPATVTRDTTGTLPVTGADDTARLALLAVALLAGGFTALLSSRRLLGHRLERQIDAGR